MNSYNLSSVIKLFRKKCKIDISKKKITVAFSQFLCNKKSIYVFSLTKLDTELQTNDNIYLKEHIDFFVNHLYKAFIINYKKENRDLQNEVSLKAR